MPKTEIISLNDQINAELFCGSEFIVHEIWQELCYEKQSPILAGMKVVDLGANQGVFSLFALMRGAQVLAVEPLPSNFALLQKNVESNGFTDRVTLLNCAASAQRGELVLNQAQGQGSISSGMVSAAPHIQGLLQKLGIAVEKEHRVPALPLSEILQTWDHIDLLKVDVEGSEGDIFQGTDAQTMSKVQGIVMELHDAYSQKDLYYRIIELGFEITAYEQISGAYGCGMLFARRRNTPEVQANGEPVVFWNPSPHMAFGDAMILDASQSFGRHPQIPVEYIWTVDGEIYQGVELSYLHIDSIRRGLIEIQLKVVQGSWIKSLDHKIWVLDQEGDWHGSERLSQLQFQECFLAHGQNDLILPWSLFPQDWDFPLIKMDLESLNMPFDAGDYVEWNGQRRSLNGAAHSLYFRQIPRQDLRLRIYKQIPSPARISFWPLSSGPQCVDFPMNILDRAVQLDPIQKVKTVSINQTQEFCIPRALFPLYWQPLRVVLQVLHGEGAFREFDLELEQNGQIQELKAWSAHAVLQIEFSPVNHPVGIFFKLRSRQQDSIRLSWWAE